MKKRLVLICNLLFLMPAILLAQKDVDAFLLSSENDSEVKSIEQQLDYLQSKPYRLAPLQKLELRTTSNQLDPARQEYAVRMNPANPWEVRSNNQYFRQYQSMLELKKGIALKEALYDRYILVADLLYHQELRDVREKERVLIDTYIRIMEEQQYSDFFDGEDYVKLKLDQIDRDVEAEEAIFERDDVVRQITSMYDVKSNPATWDMKQVISSDRMMLVVDSIYNAQLKPAILAYYDERISLAKREYALEKANINLGFLQATYEDFRKEQGRRPWSLSAGVTIPLFNPNKGDMAKRKIKVMEEEQEQDEIKSEQQSTSLRHREQLRSLINRYNGIQAKIKSLSVDNLSRTLNTMQGNNPAVKIRLSSNILKLETIAVKLKQNILYAYIEFLTQMDVLQQQPMINYFTPALKPMMK